MGKYIIEDAPTQEASPRPTPSNKYIIEDAQIAPSAPVSVGEDIAKSAAIGVPKGAAGLVGLPGTIGQAGNNAENQRLQRIDELVAMKKQGALPDPKDMTPGDRSLYEDTLGLNPYKIAVRKYGPQAWLNKGMSSLPSGEDIQHGIESVTGEWYKPKTAPGRVAEFTGELVASMGKPSLPKAGQVLTSGLAGGTAGELVSSVTDNKYLKALAQMLGTFAGGAPWAMRNTPASNIKESLEGVTEQQMKQAQQLMDDAAKMGTPITGAEALAKVTGGNRLQAVQRVVEGSQKGSQVMQPMMNARPLNNQVAFNQQADQITTLPARQANTPVQTAERAQSVIDEARKIRTQNVTPEYSTLTSTNVPGKVVYVQRAIQQALKGVDEGSQSASILKSMAMRLNSAKNAAQVDNIYKEFRDRLGALPIDKNALTTTEKGVITPVNEKLGEVLKNEVPAIAQGRAKYQQITNDLVNPVKNSPIGDLAKTASQENAQSQMTAQMNILMPAVPRALDPKTIRGTIKALNVQDAKVLAETGQAAQTAKDWTRQALESQFNEFAAMKQGGGATFAEKIAGNPAQRDNLQALITETGGKQAWIGFNKMLQVFEAQGKRLAAGSPTFENAQLAKGLGGGLESAPSLMKRVGNVGAQAIDKWRYGSNTGEMARILTDPKSIELMKKIAMTQPNSRKAQLLVSELIAGNPGQSGE